MIRPLLYDLPICPPGYERSPTLLLLGSGGLQHTPTSPRAHPGAAADVLPAGLATLVAPCSQLGLLEKLFCVRQLALLAHADSLPRLSPSPASPTSTPPRRPTARRKTLAGVRINSSAGGISL
ncbi:hypothetical protein ZWY2020_042496 [Hordeum vulgare]|nr:hypothetical protein ZWY2020_042496 [Hordeum vulgare]